MGIICREWMGARDPKGYGRRARHGWASCLVHRQVWEMANGPIPPGMVVMHTCDNPSCYLLEHLRLGTIAENQRDMVTKGRSRLIGDAHRLPDDAPCPRCGESRSRRGANQRLRCIPCEVAYNRARGWSPRGVSG